MGNMESGTVIPVSTPASAYDGLAKSFGSFADSLMTQAANKKKLDAAEMLQARAEVKRMEENAPIVERAAKKDVEVAAKDTFVTKAGANTVEDVLGSGMSAEDKTKHVYGSLYDSINGITLENAKEVKSTLTKNAKLLSPEQQESLWTAYNSNVSTIAKAHNTVGSDVDKGIYTSALHKKDMQGVEAEADEAVGKTKHMEVKNTAIAEIDRINNDKTVSPANKKSQISKVRTGLKSYFDTHKEDIAAANATIDANKNSKIADLDKKYANNYDSLVNLLSPSAKKNMETHVEGELKKRNDAQILLDKRGQEIFAERAGSLINPLVNASGTRVIGSEKEFKQAMLGIFNGIQKADAEKYGSSKYVMADLEGMDNDYFDDGLEIDYSKAFQDYKKSRNDVVKTNQDIISKNLGIEAQRVAVKGGNGSTTKEDEQIHNDAAKVKYLQEYGVPEHLYMLDGKPSRALMDKLITSELPKMVTSMSDKLDKTVSTSTTGFLVAGDIPPAKMNKTIKDTLGKLPTEGAKYRYMQSMDSFLVAHKAGTTSAGNGIGTVNEKSFNDYSNSFYDKAMEPTRKREVEEKTSASITALKNGYASLYKKFSKDGTIDPKEQKTLDALAAHAKKQYKVTFDK